MVATFHQKNDLVKIAGLESHLGFIQELQERYNWSASLQEEVAQTLHQINERRSDPNLYTAVIGEFSSGKSTFINALIRDNLLQTDVVQATTSAPTMIRYHSELDIQIEFNTGESKSYQEDGLTFFNHFTNWFKTPSLSTKKQRLRKFIHAVTADEQLAVDIRMVNLFHPTETLRHGLVIVDTPGANSENQRHSEVARWAVSERCDAALVIIPADTPVSQSLVQFLKQAVPDVLHRCIFVVTKMDLIRRKKEHEPLLKTIKQRLLNELGLSSATVWAAAPQLVLDHIMQETNEDSRLSKKRQEEFLKQFYSMEVQLWRTLETQRTLILTERLSLLMSKLFSRLPEGLKLQEENYRARHEKLMKNQIPDLEIFIKKQKNKHLSYFRINTKDWSKEATRQINEEELQFLQQTKTLLFQSQTKEELKQVMESGVNSQLAEIQSKVQQIMMTIVNEILPTAQKQQKEFEKDFRKIYKSLAALNSQLENSIQEQMPHVNDVQISMLAQTGQLKMLIEESEETEVVATLGGAGLGATIGTFITPGIGTAVGGAIGWFIGSLIAPSLDELKDESWAKLSELIHQSFEELKENAEIIVEKTLSEAESEMSRVIDLYFELYSALVQQMRYCDQQELNALRKRRDLLEQDQSTLSHKKSQLEKSISSLKKR